MPDHTQFQDTNGNAPRRFTRWIWMGAFLLSGGVAGGLVGGLHPGLWPSIAILLVPCALFLAAVREANRNAIAKGCATSASNRYKRRMLILGPGYLFAAYAVLGMFGKLEVTGPALWAAALLPAVPILGIICSIGLYIAEESDDYQRGKIVFASMVATGVLLCVATVWGGLEHFGLARHAEFWLAFPIWVVGLSIGRLIHRWRQA